MKPTIPPINTPDGRFSDGDPSKEILGTIVTATFMNNSMDATRNMQDELSNVVIAGGLTPDATKTTQVRDAIIKIIEKNGSGGIPEASITQAGIVQLTNAKNSTSETLAPTAKALKDVYDIVPKGIKVTGGIAGSSNGMSVTNEAVNAVAIGSYSNTLDYGIAIGERAKAGKYGISIGKGALENSKITVSTVGDNVNIALGSSALNKLENGVGNIAVGTSGYNIVNGNHNLTIGHSSGPGLIDGTYNTLIGGFSGSAKTKDYNTALGYQSFYIPANTGITDVTNSTSIGYLSSPTGSNQVQLGNSQTTTYVYGTVQNRSDLRDKADIRDTNLGLYFLLNLRPVDYKWDLREDYIEYIETEVEVVDPETGETRTELRREQIQHERDGSKKRNRYHHGFIAQEVKGVADMLRTDFGGYQDHSKTGGKDVFSLGYDEFIAPIVKSIQELHGIIQYQQEEINRLKNKVGE